MGKMYEMLKAAKIVNTEGGGEPPVFIEKTITENGTYVALDDEVDGYSKVTVDVPSGGTKLLQNINGMPSGKRIKKRFWETVTFTGLTNVSVYCVWTDGEATYYSNEGDQYVLNKETLTWEPKSWNETISFGNRVWTDGENIYYSYEGHNYILDKSTSTWSTKSWNGLTRFDGRNIWSDGENIYYSESYTHYILDKDTSTWTTKSWSGLASSIGCNIWTDGENIYYSSGNSQYVLDKSTSTWTTKSWEGTSSITGMNIWSDGENIYHGGYVLYPTLSKWVASDLIANASGLQNTRCWTDGENVYYTYAGTGHVLRVNDDDTTLVFPSAKQ
jgi:hypothetical protein